MSWFKSLQGETPERYVAPPEETTVKDPSIPNRMVSNKTANQPFLAYREYKDRQEALHKAWVERKKERDEKIARGEKVGPLEPDPTAQKEVGVLGLLKFLLYATIFMSLAGKFFTGSYTWEYESKWTKLKTFWPTNQRLFSERLLSEFDGRTPGLPIYLAIDGDVYDVSKGHTYQPGGSYHILTGVDAARAFGTGCFKDHRTHDLRGLSDSELRSVEHWKKFYAEHKDYVKIGRVSHPPIDPASPIPPHCNPKKDKVQNTKTDSKERAKPSKENTVVDHEEL